MQHIEFIHTDHFSQRYHRSPAPAPLALFIDFFWQTDFDNLWSEYPEGFSDVLFPNTGYTYLINLGTPFIMEVGNNRFPMKSDGYLPRDKPVECYHTSGNCLFGIKFKTSPILFEKKVNFGEYRNSVFPLSYLVDGDVVKEVKAARTFEERVRLLSDYFLRLVSQYDGELQPVRIVTKILDNCDRNMHFNTPVEQLAAEHGVSARTLQRYFETHTGVSTKKVMQILRIRRAVETLLNSRENFSYERFGYYDHSHFCKHLKQFCSKESLNAVRPHLLLLEKLHSRRS